jgi:hypothetical protein
LVVQDSGSSQGDVCQEDGEGVALEDPDSNPEANTYTFMNLTVQAIAKLDKLPDAVQV